MANYNEVKSLIENPVNQKQVIKRYQDTKDIMKELLYMFAEYKYQAKPVAHLFDGGSIKKSGKNIWSFIKDNIKYVAEPEKNQTSRSFSRIIYDKWGDCKHSALLASSIGWQLGYDVVPKFVNYEDKTKRYGHVYTILVDPKTKEQVIIDPLQDFDYQKDFYRAQNYYATNTKNKNMALSRLTGIGVDDESLAGIGSTYDISGVATVRMITGDDLISGIGKAKKPFVKPLLKATTQAAKNPIKSALRPAQTARNILKTVAPKAASKIPVAKKPLFNPKGKVKDKFKAKAAVVKSKIKARGGVLKTVALAPVRAAGTVALLANFRGFASRLKKLNESNPAKIQALAKQFGYVPATLISQINKGAAKKPLLGSKQNGIAGIGDMVAIEGLGYNGGIGVIALSAAVTTAAPLILAITKLLKDHNLAQPGDEVAEAESTLNMSKAPDIAEEGGDASEGSDSSNQRQMEQPEAATEQYEEGETIESPANKTKFAEALEKVEAFTKAADKGAKVYAEATTKPTTKYPVKTAEDKDIPEEAKGFFAKLGDSVKEHPVLWFGGTALVVGGGYMLAKK